MRSILVTVYIFFLCFQVASSASCSHGDDCKGSGHCDISSHHWECHFHRCYCRHGTSIVTSTDGRFTFHSTQKTFQEAEAACQAQGQHLVKIDSADKYKEVKDFGSKLIRHTHPDGSSYSGVWIGLRRDDSQQQGATFRYTDGTIASYFEWESGEPNRFDLEACIRLDTDHLLMRTTGCDSDHEFICENVSNPNVTAPAMERCVEKEDCSKQCKSSEYHCIEYGCHCGEIH